MNKGLGSTLGLGGSYIPQHIMNGAIGTGNFQGFWIFDTDGALIDKRTADNALDPPKLNGLKFSLQNGQLLIFKRGPFTYLGQDLGSIVGAYHIPIAPLVSLMGLLAALFILISFIINRSINKLAEDITAPIVDMTNEINHLQRNQRTWGLTEIDNLYATLKDYLKRSQEAEDKLRSAIVSKKVAFIAYKVRHDIKSSLYLAEGKLNAIPSDLSHITSGLKSIFERIYNIADDIPKFEGLDQFEDEFGESEDHDIRNTHIASIAAEIVNDFSTSNLDGKQIDFKLEYENESFHSFAKVDISKLKRVFVNLLKNSVDAISENGVITMILSNDDDNFYISIKDNGLGMTEDQLEQVGRPGVSFKNGQGTGLGLASAIPNVQIWNGTLDIESSVNVGTEIKITLPLAEENFLMPTQIVIEPNTEVIVADDDPLYRNLYEEKLKQDHFKKAQINCVTLVSINEVKDRISALSEAGRRYLLLSDHDYGEETTGVELVSSLKDSSSSILVSSNGTNPKFLKTCAEASLQVISKSILDRVDFSVAG